MMELKWTTIEAVRSGRAGSASIVETQYAEWRGMTLMRTTITNNIGQTCYVDGPHQVTAPHCQPTPPADDRPPMTDADLVTWLTATHGEPKWLGGLLWWDVDPHSGRAAHHDPDLRDKSTNWTIVDDQGISTPCPASIAGPALHAAHRYGAP
jgi:hypothetical protein